MDKWKEEVVGLVRNGVSWRSAAKLVGKPKSTVSDYLRGLLGLNNPFAPKVVFIDIESAPAKVAAFNRFNINLNEDNILEEGFLLSVSWKWQGNPTVNGVVLTGEEAVACNDYRVAEALWHVLNNADIVIAHNGDNFDLKMARRVFLKHNFAPPKYYYSVDTLKIVRRAFKLPSNRLGSIAKFLGVEDKQDSGGMKLWVGCMQGDESSLEKMMQYNKQDVIVLEQVYDKLIAWDKAPKHGLYINRDVGVNQGMACPKCGDSDTIVIGTVATATGIYHQHRCNSCNGVSRCNKVVGSTTKTKWRLVAL